METISIENGSLYHIQAWYYEKRQKDKEYYREKDPDYANVITDLEGYVIDVEDNEPKFNQYNEGGCNDPREFIAYRFYGSDLEDSEKIIIIFAVAQDCEEVSYENLEEGVTPECNEDMYEGGEFTYFAVNGEIKSFSEFKD